MRFILASSSPRRRELLTSIGLHFDVVPSHTPEEHQPGEAPEEYVARLSREKAKAVAAKHPPQWVIAADAILRGRLDAADEEIRRGAMLLPEELLVE